MNKFIGIAAVALALSAPVASFAQSNQPLTRAEVRAQIVQLEKAGYNPGVISDSKYPADIQAAEARVAAQNGTAQSAFGGAVDGAAQSGARAYSPIQGDVFPTFAHH
ncbi:membrane protein [Caballeronia peredens]|nr:membrane protein [Caballeronia peredens]